MRLKMENLKPKLLTLLAIGLGFATNTYADNKDPYESYNRHAFAMNQTLDKVVFIPFATIYKTAMPNFAQKGVHNFFSNIADVNVVANDVLQLKGYQSLQDTTRIFFNSTIGLLGLFDVASHMDLPEHTNDFGQTLAQWGYKNSNYFVIPILGPSTIRDAIGTSVDLKFLNAYPYIDNVQLRNQLLALDFIQLRAYYLQYQDVIDQAAFDPYVFQRNAYLQRRTYLIKSHPSETQSQTSTTDSNDPYVE